VHTAEKKRKKKRRRSAISSAVMGEKRGGGGKIEQKKLSFPRIVQRGEKKKRKRERALLAAWEKAYQGRVSSARGSRSSSKERREKGVMMESPPRKKRGREKNIAEKGKTPLSNHYRQKGKKEGGFPLYAFSEKKKKEREGICSSPQTAKKEKKERYLNSGGRKKIGGGVKAEKGHCLVPAEDRESLVVQKERADVEKEAHCQQKEQKKQARR